MTKIGLSSESRMPNCYFIWVQNDTICYCCKQLKNAPNRYCHVKDQESECWNKKSLYWRKKSQSKTGYSTWQLKIIMESCGSRNKPKLLGITQGHAHWRTYPRSSRNCCLIRWKGLNQMQLFVFIVKWGINKMLHIPFQYAKMPLINCLKSAHLALD